MIGLNKLLDGKKLHLVFELSLWFKAIFALSEIAAGVVTYFVPQRLFLTFVRLVTQDEFAEDPHDLVANFLLHTVQHLSVDTQKFAAIYLLGHGVIKLWLIIGLLCETLVLSHFHDCFRPVHWLPGLSIYIHALSLVVARHGLGHRRYRPHLARIPISPKRAEGGNVERLAGIPCRAELIQSAAPHRPDAR
ncbi:DUF2127 domain-containing protein [Burkholderia contaminans]|uniref:DUF2127 domain-containing protein n=1 Tax=Burkholderia contaminans TaxID=488447 RepID=UPI004046251B